MRHRNWSVVILIGAMLLAPGCGGPRPGVVRGRVLFPDGSPLARGRVVFECQQPRGKGEAPLGSDGTFTTPELNPGQYAVFILGAEPDAPPTPSPGGSPSPALIDEKFTDPETSGLTITVGSADKAEFTVTRPAKR